MPTAPKTYPATITSTNCHDMIGCSWKWVVALCRRHDVPIWQVGGRRVVPTRALLAAMERASAQAAPVSFADEVAAAEREFAAAVRKPDTKDH